MASILAAADLHKIKIAPIFDSKDAAYFARALTQLAAKHGAATQAAWAVALLNIRDERMGVTVDLAHEIVMRQIDKCQQFGGNAFPLSEKQIAVVAAAAAKAIGR